MKDVFTVLLLLDDKDLVDNASEALAKQKYRIVHATTAHEAKLKYSNEEFHMAVIGMDIKGVNAQDFVEMIRRKERLRAVKDKIPVLVVGKNPEEFASHLATIDNVKYIESPFSTIEFKKKLLTFGGHSDTISNNTKTIRKGEYLLTEGGTSHEMYWILSGCFTITKLNQDDKNVIIGEVLPGELVGEMSFLDNLPRSASVRAKEDCEVLVIPHKKFIDVLDNQPRWFRTLMQTLSERLRKADAKIVHKHVVAEESQTKEE